MRKIILVMSVLMLAGSSLAEDIVTIAAVDEDGGVVRIDYSVSDANLVRLFALDVTVDDGNIVSILDHKESEGNVAEPGYIISAVHFEVENRITVEIEAQYVDVNSPAVNGTLCRVAVTRPCFLNVSENALLGGVIMEDPNIIPIVDLTGATYVYVNCPCMGDVTGDNRVDTDDMNVLLEYLFLYGRDKPRYEVAFDLWPHGYECLNLDGNWVLNTTDMNMLLFHLFLHGDPGDGYSSGCYVAP